MRTTLLIGLVAAGVAAGAATAAGPTPGFAPAGVVGPRSTVRYVAVPRNGTTFVKAVRVGDNRMLRSTTLRREYGVPMVAFDGTAGGLARDGKTLVLETTGSQTLTRFAVLSTQTLKVRQSFALRGWWGYDAISPDGKTLYLIQVLPATDTIRYLVRAYDLGLRQLVKGAIADKSEPGAMAGYPVSRATTADGTWAYTLYQRPNAQPFVHALNTRERRAICVDLDWKGDPNNLGNVRLTLSADEQQLVVRRFADGKALLTIAAPH
jgi:hypothetical protein